MNDESRLLMHVWEAVGDFIRTGEKDDAAAVLVRALVDLGYELDDFNDAQGECPYIDRAIDDVAAEDEEEEEDDSEEY